MLVSVALTLSHLRVSPCVCRINVSVFGAWRDACASIRFLCVLQSALKQWKANDCDVKTTPTCTSWSFSSFPCDHKPFSLLWCCAQQQPMAHLSHLIFIYKCQPVMCWWSQTVKYWTMLYGSNNLGRSIVWFSSLIFFHSAPTRQQISGYVEEMGPEKVSRFLPSMAKCSNTWQYLHNTCITGFSYLLAQPGTGCFRQRIRQRW